jgi:hypothetical protein
MNRPTVLALTADERDGCDDVQRDRFVTGCWLCVLTRTRLLHRSY